MMATNYPAGLNDLNFELYKRFDKIFALNNGNTIEYAQLPVPLLQYLDEIIEARPRAHKALTFINLIHPDDRRIKFISCNLANFDFTADINSNLNAFTTEYVPCNLRGGACPVEGKLCQPIDAPNGKLSLRELKVMGMIRIGMFDKEITEALFIAPDTLKTTKRNIQRKLGVERKAGIANIAAHLQIC